MPHSMMNNVPANPSRVRLLCPTTVMTHPYGLTDTIHQANPRVHRPYVCLSPGACQREKVGDRGVRNKNVAVSARRANRSVEGNAYKERAARRRPLCIQVHSLEPKAQSPKSRANSSKAGPKGPALRTRTDRR